MARKPAASEKKESVWRQRARRFAYVVVIVQLVGIVAFLGVLLVGERSRFTLIALYLPRHPLLIASIGAALLVPFARRRVKILLPVQIVLSLVVFFPVMGCNVATSRHLDKPIRLVTY